MKKKFTPLMLLLGLGIIAGFFLTFLNFATIGGALIGGCTAALIVTIKNKPHQDEKG